MRIGLVSQWYPPEGAFIQDNLAAELVARGHEVKVLTSFPSYPYGQVYPGYRQRWYDCVRTGGLTVRRVPSYPSHDRSPVRRAASYLSFAATSAVAAARYLADVDVTYVYHPPPTSVAAAVVGRLLRGTPAVLHVQDPWPESVLHSGMAPQGHAGRLLDGAIAGAMRRIYRSVTAIAVISPAMAELVIERGADPDQVRVVWNWTDDRLFRPVPATDAARAAIGHTGRCTIMFAGNLGLLQGIETAVRAAAATRDLVDLVLVGSGVQEESARRLAADLGAHNVRFLDRRPPERMAELYAVAEYQLICLRDAAGLRGTVPSKLQAALACGRSVIVSAGGDAARLVRSARVGLTCPPEDWRALADRFATAAAQPAAERRATGDRARQVYLDRMSLRVGVDQLEDIMIKAADRGRRR
ncbi:glycosyltransferase family 4 protein [Micromonospora rubida]|uniref:glycosyltransferase family 4 protein n=1 Tax=Micromonospora rubida TaxID=2697657 RepID=UPI0013773AE4|nr:glycosyltransferase family 4 protein [Micromonospora rubida]NBE84206.1 glycosyltransferase [Micromonospora rubida]